MFKSKLLLFFTVIFVTILLFPGCGSQPPAANKWTKLLSVIPADESTLKSAYLRDDAMWDELREQYAPAEPLLQASFDNYYFPASGGDYVNAQRYNDADWQKDLGFIAADVSGVIIAGRDDMPPPKYYQAAEVQFDKATIDNAVRTGSLHEDLEVKNYQGQDYYYTGPDNKVDLTVQSGAHFLGMDYRMALLDNDIILWSTMTAPMEGMIDSYKNKIDSLADAEDYQSLANTLTEYNTFYAYFTSESYSLSHIKQVYQEFLNDHELNGETRELSDKRLAALEKAVPLKPFNALASGVGLDENGYYLVIALANSDEDAASQNADFLKQRLDEAKDLQPEVAQWVTYLNGESEISTEGNITIAKLYGDAYKLWRFFSMYQTPMWGFVNDAFIVTE